MLKIFPKYLNFENISKKCIRVLGPLRYLNFFPKLFVNVGNFNKVNFNLKVNSKTYDVTNWEVNNYNTVHISGSRNQTMKFDHLIEYNMQNIFLQES